MENHRQDTVIIFAGYPWEMEAFLDRNPGLRSRVAFHVPFPDYTPEELCAIGELTARDKGMRLAPDAREKLLDILRRYTDEDHRLSQKEIVDILRTEYDMTVDRKAVKRNLMNPIEFGYEVEYSESVRMIPDPKTGQPEENYILSNFYQHPFVYNGLTYSNVEAAFQAQKCADDAGRVKYTQVKTPSGSSRWGAKRPCRTAGGRMPMRHAGHPACQILRPGPGGQTPGHRGRLAGGGQPLARQPLGPLHL